MRSEPLVARAEVAGSPERIGTDEHALARPPKRDFLPGSAESHCQEVERSDRLLGHDVMRAAGAFRPRDAVTPVAIQQLDHTGRCAGRAHTLLDSAGRDRVDQPDASVRDERVGAALQELVLDPAEAGVELVYRFHSSAQRSKPGKSFARAALISSSTSKGMRRNWTARFASSTRAYSLNGSNGTRSSGSLCSHTSPTLPTLNQSTRPTRRSHCRCT